MRSNLAEKSSTLSHLTEVSNKRKKYERLIDTEFQNLIQQNYSTIRGKVDDLKKKIKEINKDILSFEQEHSELIDELSNQISIYEDQKEKNNLLEGEIRRLRSERKK